LALASSSLLPRIVGSLERRKWWWFGAWWLHCILMHWYLLGFITWDAMGYRGLPIIELAQHGDLGDGKYLD